MSELASERSARRPKEKECHHKHTNSAADAACARNDAHMAHRSDDGDLC